MIAEEQVRARARLAELEEKVARAAQEAAAQALIEAEGKARADATNSRVQEAQLIRIARGATMGLFVGLRSMTATVPLLGAKVADGLKALATKPSLDSKELLNITRITKELTASLRTLSETGQRVMEMDRLLLGEPTNILAVQHSDLSLEEAARRIEAGRRALEYARQEGITIDVTPKPSALPAHAPTQDASLTSANPSSNPVPARKRSRRAKDPNQPPQPLQSPPAPSQPPSIALPLVPPPAVPTVPTGAPTNAAVCGDTPTNTPVDVFTDTCARGDTPTNISVPTDAPTDAPTVDVPSPGVGTVGTGGGPPSPGPP